jgi:transposase
VSFDELAAAFERLRAEHDALEGEHAALSETHARTLQERDAYRKNLEVALVELEKLRRNLHSVHERERVSSDQLRLALETLASAVPSLAPLIEGGAGTSTGGSGRGTKPEDRRPGHGRRPIPEHLPIVEIRVDVPEESRVGMEPIGEETADTIEWRRGGYVRVRVVRPKYADPNAPERGVACEEAPRRPYPKAYFGPTLIARILFGKYGEHMPLARLEKSFARDGFEIARGTMCGVVESACEHGLRRIVDAMIEDSRRAHTIATDATGIPVQAKDKCRTAHVFVSIADRDHVVFHYTKKHDSAAVTEIFKGFRGYLLADASSVYEALYRDEPDKPALTEVACWAHARRYFFKAVPSDPTRALQGLALIDRLFALERELADKPPERRRAARRARAAPILDAFAEWRNQQLAAPDVVEKSPIAAALRYSRNQWTALCRFLDDGRLPIHNNGSELQLRHVVIGRKNWLFVGTDDFGEHAATISSLIASAKLHGLDPEAYLRDVLRVLPYWPATRVLELAPKHWARTRERLDLQQLEQPLGHVDVPAERLQDCHAA